MFSGESFGTVTPRNRLAVAVRELAVDLGHTLGKGNQLLDNEVEKAKQEFRRSAIITQADLTGMNSVVADDTDGIEGLLNLWVKSGLNQRCDVIVEVFTRVSQLDAELLDSQSQ